MPTGRSVDRRDRTYRDRNVEDAGKTGFYCSTDKLTDEESRLFLGAG